MRDINYLAHVQELKIFIDIKNNFSFRILSVEEKHIEKFFVRFIYSSNSFMIFNVHFPLNSPSALYKSHLNSVEALILTYIVVLYSNFNFLDIELSNLLSLSALCILYIPETQASNNFIQVNNIHNITSATLNLVFSSIRYLIV